MPPGKLAAQAGHAYTDVLDLAQKSSPEIALRYRNRENGGSKVTLKAKNTNQLIKAYEDLIDLGIPATLVVDQGHILPPHFNGNPIITALGVGPCTQFEVKQITKKFQCV
jgi:PTH2 family peptidyl-tRNA hydrolase